MTNAFRWLRRRLIDGDVLAFAATLTIAPMFLSNNYNLAPRLLIALIFPAAVISLLSIQVARDRPWTIEVSLRTAVTFSILITAAVVYVAMITISDWRNATASQRELDRQIVYVVQITLFMLAIAMATVAMPKFLPRMMGLVATVAAVSAAINIKSFIAALPRSTENWPSYRLVNWLGMPGYTNSTNISITYAVLAVGSIALIARRGISRYAQVWLAAVSIVLLAGVVTTQSRSAYTGVVVGVAVILVVLSRLTYRTIAIGGAAAVVLALVLAVVPQAQNVITSRGSSYRPEIWRIYLDRAAAKPWLGYGGLSQINIRLSDGMEIDQPHNLVLSAQVRGGVGAMLAMLTLLLGSLYWSWRYLRLSKDVLPLAMIATLTAIGMFDYNLLVTALTWPWVTFWLPFAVAAGAEMTVRRGCSVSAATGAP